MVRKKSTTDLMNLEKSAVHLLQNIEYLLKQIKNIFKTMKH